MGWTRNLQKQTAAGIAGALEATTWETLTAKTGGGDIVEHKVDMLNAADRALMPVAVAAAKAGVEELGGEAFVHMQAQNRLIVRNEYGPGAAAPAEGEARPPETVLGTRAVRIRCVVVTITTETEIEER